MVVSLNLLGRGAAEERPAADWSFAAGLCLFLLAVTFTAVMYEYCLFSGLCKKRAAVEEELRSAKNELSILNTKFADAESRLNGIEEMLDFMLGGARAGEVLSLLVACAAANPVVVHLLVAIHIQIRAHNPNRHIVSRTALFFERQSSHAAICSRFGISPQRML